MVARVRKMLICCLTSIATFFSFTAMSEEIALFAHEQKPFQYKNKKGQTQGFVWELVHDMFELADVKVKVRNTPILPFARAYKIVERTSNTAMFMTVRKAKREKLFQWVGPIASREKWLYKLTANDLVDITDIEQAKNYTVGTVNNSSTDDYLKKLGFDKLTLLGDESLVFGMFLARRIELIPSLELTMAFKLQERGLTYSKVEKVLPFDSRYQYYLAVNKDVDPKIVARLQGALDKMKANGGYSSLRSKYFN